MKKVSALFSFVLVLSLFFSAANFAYADLCPKTSSGFASLCDLKLDKASDITGNIVTVLLIFAIIVALIYLVYGGIRWSMSAGDKQKMETARITITGAIVGLVIALSAYFFLNIVTYLFTGNTFLDFTIPTIVPVVP